MRQGDHFERYLTEPGFAWKKGRRLADHVYDCVVEGFGYFLQGTDAVAVVGVDGDAGDGLVVDGADDEDVSYEEDVGLGVGHVVLLEKSPF
jgi:hypothetical protein